MKNVLIVGPALDFSAGGVETYLINTLSRMERTSYNITFFPGRIAADSERRAVLEVYWSTMRLVYLLLKPC